MTSTSTSRAVGTELARRVLWAVGRMGKASRVAAAVLLSLARTADARASDGDLERARALFNEAGDLEQKGQWGAADQCLRGALRIRETPQLRYALGWALENEDRLVEARTEYELAGQLGRAASVEEVVRLSSERLNALAALTPRIEVHVAEGGRTHARVQLDGRELVLTADSAATPVNPGSHVVRVEQNGRVAEQTVYAARSSTEILEIAADVTFSNRPRGRTSASILPWVLAGTGGALVIGSIALFVSSSSDASERDARHAEWCTSTACMGSTATLPETAAAQQARAASYEASNRGNTKQIVGGVLGSAGVVAVAAGTIFALRHPAKSDAIQLDGAPMAGGAFARASFAF